MKVSPIFKPHEKPVHPGWYVAWPDINDIERAKREVHLGVYPATDILGKYLDEGAMFYFSADGYWYFFADDPLRTSNQDRYWFGLVKDEELPENIILGED